MRLGRPILLVGIVVLALVAAVALGTGWPGNPFAPAAATSAAIPSGITLGPGGDRNFAAIVPEVRRARALQALTPADAAGGAPMVAGGQVLPLEAGQEVVLFGEPITANGDDWQYGYVVPTQSGDGPDDYFAWMPRTKEGQTLLEELPTACPRSMDLSHIAALDPFTRVKCVGAASFVLEGRTWSAMTPAWYDVQPDWLGGSNGPAPHISIHAGELQRFPQIGEVTRFIDVQLPPGVAVPPSDFAIRVAVHFADPRADDCRRQPGQNSLVPREKQVDTRLWCATRLVGETWLPLLGPEGRPINPLDPQLHRFPDPGPNSACGGVGLPPLVFRIDASAPDPVHLVAEAQPDFGPFDVIPWFTPEFRAIFTPDLVVVDGAGRVVARDGMRVDPDADLLGHHLCPTGQGVYID